MRETITYLEMSAFDELRPGRVVAEVALEPLTPESPLIKSMQERIGTPYAWPSARRTDAEWAAVLARPLRRFLLITYQGEPAGFVDFEFDADGGVEITTFGLVPEYVGRGLGGHALTLAVRAAWAAAPAGAEQVRRVWLHTSSLDHPNALPNYRSRGFRPFRTRVNERPDEP
ncbi:acetyltransferase (GNAT) family protein [Murinocardiopsis flavida]|uniref:Acetyltransferase (GNAT) family protein n=1 Tax=Murinocardiopsis flavida TaxID=645275 RepID=A0A2P8DV04_9ACTN|nr:GNAT family N-acetyltransferase [Murinocardiopsis flavida]PSL01024.1 acetyltransferase (GNAT) family protein [Murinocardiopsis flavida]